MLDRGVVTAPDNVLITAGAQQGIDLVLRSCVTPEDVILVEEPTYVGLLELAALRRQRIVSIPTDHDGIQLEALEEACQHYRPRMLYLIPTFNNPTGSSLAAERREALLQLARRYNLLIVEDDIYGLLYYDQQAPLPLKTSDSSGQIIYLFSFSKVLLPALRLCAVVAAPEQMQALASAKRSSDLLCSPILQHALAHYLKRHLLQAHIQQLRPLY
ncbi:aminotransferase-like domain-containing protein [Dictyobacter kobayashii]|uniref:aminotransferase-like domain-containing protein n=1 Tax=Dictyobacter kobayashii TaxID=2014872 RepID=UPI0013874832|nr:PLP-dependent aminotransferase family protein [Dictyobacter kobayashii]